MLSGTELEDASCSRAVARSKTNEKKWRTRQESNL